MYVVLRQGTDDCSCFQLMNYQQSSVALERPETQAYVIAYTGNIGHDRNTRSVHVRADSAVDQLGPACHVDLSELTKVSYRLRVKAFGNVGQTSMHNLAAQFVSFCEQTEDTQQPIAAGVSRGQPSAQYLSNQTLPQHSQQQTSESEDDSEADDDSTMENPAPVISPKRLFQHLEIRSTAVHPSMAKVSRFVPNKELRIALPSRSQPMTPSTRELIIGDEGVLSTLFPDFRIRRTKFWTVGRVIVVLWGEPEGPNATRSSLAHSGRTTVWEPGIELNQVGERMFSKIRQFVIIREGKGYCYALPISTYAGRGVSDAGVVKSEHCIIYTGKLPPTPTADERPRGNEEAMQPVAIRLDPDTPDNLLDPMSRINLAAITILQDNNKVKPFGKINPISLNNLISQHDAVCKRRPAVGQARFPQHFDLVDREGESDEDDDEDDDEDEDEEGDDDNDDDA